MRALYSCVVRVLPTCDAFTLAVCFALTWHVSSTHPLAELVFAILSVHGWLSAYKYFGVYHSHRIGGFSSLLRSLASAHIVVLTACAAVLWVAGLDSRLPSLLNFAGLAALCLLLPRAGFYIFAEFLRTKGFDARNVCVIGTWEDAHSIQARFLEQPEWGLSVAFVGAPGLEEPRFSSYSSAEPVAANFTSLLREQVVDEVLVVARPESVAAEAPLFHTAAQHGTVCRLFMRSGGDELEPARVEPFCGGIAVALGEPRHGTAALLFKRLIDVAGGAAAVFCLSPLFAIIALLVKLSSPGPIIFRQIRVGLNGRRFTIYKFRTMIQDAEVLLPTVATDKTMNGPIFKDPHDCRITPVGMLLRRFSLDELPQLINVLLGHMSLVGPRPLPVYEAGAIEGAYRKRFSVKPGLTGLWQVSGRSQINYVNWMNYDLQYVNGWSLWLDLKLLAKTLPAVLTGRGAY